jgi:arginine exporter protein ArgO
MKSQAGSFVLGFVVASIVWVVALTILGDRLLEVFSHFSGR